MPSTNDRGPRRAVLYARVSTDERARSGKMVGSHPITYGLRISPAQPQHPTRRTHRAPMWDLVSTLLYPT
jgi:hypothetical protein